MNIFPCSVFSIILTKRQNCIEWMECFSLLNYSHSAEALDVFQFFSFTYNASVNIVYVNLTLEYFPWREVELLSPKVFIYIFKAFDTCCQIALWKFSKQYTKVCFVVLLSMLIILIFIFNLIGKKLYHPCFIIVWLWRRLNICIKGGAKVGLQLWVHETQCLFLYYY